MVLFGAKLKNNANKMSNHSPNNSKEVKSSKMIPNFSIKSFVPRKANVSSNESPASKSNNVFSIATLKRPKVSNIENVVEYN